MKFGSRMFFFLFGKHSLESDSIPQIPTLHFKRCEKKHIEKKTKKLPVCGMRIWNSPPSSTRGHEIWHQPEQAPLYAVENPSKLPQISEINFDLPKTCYLNEPFWSDSCTLFWLVLFPQICTAGKYLHQVWSPKKWVSLPWAKKALLLLTFHEILVV